MRERSENERAGSPKSSARPAVGCSRPSASRSSVVLPPPFGPGDRHELALLDAQVDAGEHGPAARVGEVDAVELER